MIKPVEGIEGFYRGSRPTFTDLQGAQRKDTGLGLTYDYSLEDNELQCRAESQWCKILGVGFFNHSLSGLWPPKKKDLNRIEQDIEDILSSGGRVFLHCLHGVDRTGIVVAKCRVMINHWAIDKAWQEFLDEGHHKTMWFLGWTKGLLK
jgi:protein tyrosine/serine phosphatase